jgi:hypothetical protein
MHWLRIGALATFLATMGGGAQAALIAGSSGPFTILPQGSQGYGVNLANGTAGDTFTADFLLTTPGAPDGSANSIRCFIGCAEIEFTSIELFAADGANDPVGPAIATGTVDVVNGTNIDVGIIASFGNLLSGSYLVRTAGTFVGTGSASIGGNVSLTPIPGAVLLLGSALAGLGAIGARRRQSASQAAA